MVTHLPRPLLRGICQQGGHSGGTGTYREYEHSLTLRQDIAKYLVDRDEL